MAEDPKNPFSGPLGTRNMGRARTGAAGGGGRVVRGRFPAKNRDLSRGIGEAMKESIAKDRKYRNTSRGIRNNTVAPLDLLWSRTEAANSNGRGRTYTSRAGRESGQETKVWDMFKVEGFVQQNMKRKGSRNRPYRANDNQ